MQALMEKTIGAECETTAQEFRFGYKAAARDALNSVQQKLALEEIEQKVKLEMVENAKAQN